MIEKTFVMVKPDGVRRGLAGEIIKRFEQRGLKVVGMKMQWIDEDFAKKHYTDDIAKRRGEQVRLALLKYVREGPVVAFVLEGVNAIENVRKIVGGTEPKSALPGTIRGDYAHVSYGHADKKGIPVMNLIHASGDAKDAEYEVRLWFSDSEMFEYKINHEADLR
jgi:nucleoside-diphosphate kinase